MSIIFDPISVADSGYADIITPRRPLTEKEIYRIYNELWRSTEIIAFVRAIERAHGIKGDPSSLE